MSNQLAVAVRIHAVELQIILIYCNSQIVLLLVVKVLDSSYEGVKSNDCCQLERLSQICNDQLIIYAENKLLLGWYHCVGA
jgi:hypothetical protein